MCIKAWELRHAKVACSPLDERAYREASFKLSVSRDRKLVWKGRWGRANEKNALRVRRNTLVVSVI